MERQREADPLIDLTNEVALSSLLQRGTKTWPGGEYNITIDLVLASEELKDSMVKCAIYGTEHGSDHRTIEAVLTSQPRFLNTWNGFFSRMLRGKGLAPELQTHWTPPPWTAR